MDQRLSREEEFFSDVIVRSVDNELGQWFEAWGFDHGFPVTRDRDDRIVHLDRPRKAASVSLSRLTDDVEWTDDMDWRTPFTTSVRITIDDVARALRVIASADPIDNCDDEWRARIVTAWRAHDASSIDSHDASLIVQLAAIGHILG